MRQAAAHGLNPDDYAAALLEEAVHTGAPNKMTDRQVEMTLAEISQFSHKNPAFAR